VTHPVTHAVTVPVTGQDSASPAIKRGVEGVLVAGGDGDLAVTDRAPATLVG